ncbi:MAG: NAD-dependent epimerase/dehydratase family protein [Candidatus Velthaea sp.]
MRVFLTGATGYIGGAICAALRAHGHAVVGLARTAEAAMKVSAAGGTPLAGDLDDGAALAAAARDTDGVIHAGAVRGPAMAETDEAAVHVLLAALEGSHKPFIYTSGAFVYGDTGDGVAGEDHPLAADSIIPWRQALEREVIAAAARGVRSVVVRVPLVYGNGGSFIIPRLLGLARAEGCAHYVGTGENRWSAVHVDDLADLFVRALHGAPAGATFNAAAGAPVRWSALAAAISRAAGVGGRVTPWTVDDARAAFGPYAPGFLQNQQLSSERAMTALGWRPHRPSVLDDVEHGSYA